MTDTMTVICPKCDHEILEPIRYLINDRDIKIECGACGKLFSIDFEQMGVTFTP